MNPIKNCGYRRLKHKHGGKKNNSNTTINAAAKWQISILWTNTHTIDQTIITSPFLFVLIRAAAVTDSFNKFWDLFFSTLSLSSFVQLKCKSKRTGMTDGEIHKHCYPIAVHLLAERERNVFAFLWIVNFSHTSYAFLLLLLLLLLWHISNIDTFSFRWLHAIRRKNSFKKRLSGVCLCVAFSSDWLCFFAALPIIIMRMCPKLGLGLSLFSLLSYVFPYRCTGNNYLVCCMLASARWP